MDIWEKTNFAEMCIPGLKSVGRKMCFKQYA